MARKSRKTQVASMQIPESTSQLIKNEESFYWVGIYARKSDIEEKRGNGNESILTQVSMLERFVESDAQLRLVDRYIDNGVTGTNFNRPEFNRLMEDVKTGRINCVIVKDLSRFGRNYLEAGKLLEVIFPYLNVRFIAVNDGYDSISKNPEERQLNAALNNLINDSYAKDISKSINAVYKNNFERGNYMGAYAPYGYIRSKADPHKLEVDHEVAEVVRKIFQMYANGESYQMIADYLNAHHVEAPSNYKYRKGILKDSRYAKTFLWRYDYIARLLGNPVYIGAIVQGKEQCRNETQRKSIRMPEEKWYIKNNMHEAIVSMDLWETVQKRKKASKEEYKANNQKYTKKLGTENILKGKLICSSCNKPLKRGHQYYKGKLIYSFYCVTKDVDGQRCPNRYQNENKLFEVIMKAIQHQIRIALDAKKVITELSKENTFHQKEVDLETELNVAENQRKKLIAKKLALYTDFCDGMITKENYFLFMQNYETEIQREDARIKDLTVQCYKQKNMMSEENRWIAEFARFRRRKKLSKDIVDALIDKIYVHGPYEIEIVFNYRDEYEYLMKEVNEAHEGGILV